MKHLYIILLLLTCSCVSVEKAKKVLDKNGLAAAEYCQDKFPVKESEKEETETVKGNTEELREQLREAKRISDSLLKAKDNLPVKPECIPEVIARDKIINQLQKELDMANSAVQNVKPDTVKKTITRTVENTAKVKALEGRLQESEANLKATTAERDKAAERAHNRGLGLIFILVSAAAFVGYKAVRFFSV